MTGHGFTDILLRMDFEFMFDEDLLVEHFHLFWGHTVYRLTFRLKYIVQHQRKGYRNIICPPEGKERTEGDMGKKQLMMKRQRKPKLNKCYDRAKVKVCKTTLRMKSLLYLLMCVEANPN